MDDPEASNRVVFGNYALLYDLGSGITGKVKLAQNISTGQRCAVKIIKKSLFDKVPELEDRVHREIALMRLLDHPHLLKLIEVCESSNHLYIVLENAEHGELFDMLIASKQLPIDFGMKIFRQLIFGLEFLHMHAICHRDLKPENILLDEFNDIKIGDFGFARWMKDSVLRTACGSPHYAAPEVVRGVPYDGRAADIWSCGVILFAVLAGHLPFNDRAIRNLLAKVKSGKYVMPDFPAEIQNLISRMLTVDPVSRLTISQIKAHPAFRIGLISPNYQLPQSLPLPMIQGPIDVSGIDPAIFEILRGVGFRSDEELIEDFDAAGTTMAKVFYMMLVGNKYDMFPWEHGAECPPSPLTDMFMLAPQLSEYDEQPADPFAPRRASGHSQNDLLTAVSPAQRIQMYEVQSREAGADIVQPCIGINLPLEVLMAKMQAMLASLNFQWFHPDDFTIVARFADLASYLTVRVKHETVHALQMDIFFTGATQLLIQMVLDGVRVALTSA
jgi:BR serine/threonine kinase